MLLGIVERVWRVLDDPGDDLTDALAVLDRMVPDEDVVAWVPELAYAQNGAIAVAHAVEVWLGDDPQCAAWAARQVYDAAEYAGRPPVEGVTVEEAGGENLSLSGREVQTALEAVEADLSAIEQSGTAQLESLFDWVWPRLPEDLHFVRTDGTTVLGTIAQEHDAWLVLTAAEYDAIAGRLPVGIRLDPGIR